MTPRDSANWQKYKDVQLASAPVDSADDHSLHWVSLTFEYAERWADLMENGIHFGSTVAECAEASSFEADFDDPLGITLLMFQNAVSMLSAFWVHGNELSRWHNTRFNPKSADDPRAETHLLDCSRLHTPIGEALIVAPYSILRDGMDRYKRNRMIAGASVLLETLVGHYESHVEATDKPCKGHCPNCKVVLDAATSVTSAEAKPNEGSISICMYCAAILRFDRQLDHVLLSVDELRELLQEDVEGFMQIGAAWWLVRQRISNKQTAAVQ